MRSLLRPLPTCAAALAAVLAGCGGDGTGNGGTDRPRVVVSAAASLGEALRRCVPGFDAADVRLSVGGSDEMAAQLRRGLRPDLLLAADARLPRELAREGLVESVRAFAANELVVAVPAASRIRRLSELREDGVRVVMGSRSSPVGTYAQEALERLGPRTRRAVLANVRSREPSVTGVIGKLVQGAADAGFVYRTDVDAARGALREIPLPEDARPEVEYAGAVVRGAAQPAAAAEFFADVLSGDCAEALRAAGFRRP